MQSPPEPRRGKPKTLENPTEEDNNETNESNEPEENASRGFAPGLRGLGLGFKVRDLKGLMV